MRIVPKFDHSTTITKQMSCGAKCLAVASDYYNKDFPVDLLESLTETPCLWITDLGSAAIKLGFKEPTVYTYSHTIFEPEWLNWSPSRFLKALIRSKSRSEKVNHARKSIARFIRLGGKLRREIVTAEIIKSYLEQRQPVIIVVASNVIHRTATSGGHYMVLVGYNDDDFVTLNPGRTVIKEERINQNLILYALYQWGGWILTFQAG